MFGACSDQRLVQRLVSELQVPHVPDAGVADKGKGARGGKAVRGGTSAAASAVSRGSELEAAGLGFRV